MLRSVKPKSPAARRVLRKREPQVQEGAKVALFVKGTTTSELAMDALKDLKNDVHPFDDPRPAEFLSQKNDATFMVLANHSKKRPNNLVFVRFFDNQIMDMVERQATVWTSPGSHVPRHLFEIDDTFKAVKNMLLDFFKGETADRINLRGLDHVIGVTVDSSKMIHIRCDGTLPNVKLTECGPALEMELRRRRMPEEVPKELKPKAVKNIERDSTGDKLGRIHIAKARFVETQTRKMKALKRKKDDGETGGDTSGGTKEDAPQPKKRSKRVVAG
ncbi:Brix domain-containing protein [Chytridium lagenaria]|nr:Brix domain-containing protein [Chytridium lagenaria]